MTQLARTPSQIGAIIRRARESKKLSQSELADGLGLRQATISEIEHGYRNAKLLTVLNILASLDLELSVNPRTISDPADFEEMF